MVPFILEKQIRLELPDRKLKGRRVVIGYTI
jgi:hypothetical protein